MTRVEELELALTNALEAKAIASDKLDRGLIRLWQYIVLVNRVRDIKYEISKL